MTTNLKASEGLPEWFTLEGEAFVRQAYQRLLNRPADAAGLKNYVAELQAGLSKAQVAAELENSPEGRLVARRRGAGGRAELPGQRPGAIQTAFQSSPPSMPRHVDELLALEGKEFIMVAYWAVLGREADPSGLADYTRRVAAGESKRQIVADMRSDPEGQAYASTLPGLDELVQAINSQQEAAAVAVASTRELLEMHGAAFVKSAYLALFKRDADADGLRRYVAVLRSGFSRSYVLSELAASPEAREKSATLAGLRELLVTYRNAQEPTWKGWYWRNVKGGESDLPPAREVRMLAWHREKN